MIGFIKRQIRRWKARKQLEREVDPQVFLTMAREIRELAQLAARTCPPDRTSKDRVSKIISEMDRLEDLTCRPEFKKLPTEKRVLLKQGLHESRDQLLEAIDSAPASTMTIQ